MLVKRTTRIAQVTAATPDVNNKQVAFRNTGLFTDYESEISNRQIY